MADISTDYTSWSTTEASNSPSGSTAVGTGLDDNLRAIQAGVAQMYSDFSSMNLASGTAVVFQQTAAPTGWTKVTTAAYNNAACRFVTGSVTPTGGATGFTSVFGSSVTTGSHTLTTTEIPSHTHTGPSHTHTFTTGTESADHTHLVGTSLTAVGGPGATIGAPTGTEASAGVSNTHTHSGTTAAGGTGATGSAGSGGGHTHTLSMDLTYVDCIVATRD